MEAKGVVSTKSFSQSIKEGEIRGDFVRKDVRGVKRIFFEPNINGKWVCIQQITP